MQGGLRERESHGWQHFSWSCKPKILPIKSITLEKLEQMEAAAAKGQPPGTAAGASLILDK